MKKKFAAMVLAAAMVASCMPASVFAEEVNTQTQAAEGTEEQEEAASDDTVSDEAAPETAEEANVPMLTAAEENGVEAYSNDEYDDSDEDVYVDPYDLRNAYVNLDNFVFEYTGEAIDPGVFVEDADLNQLTEGVDYTVSYSDNVNVGTCCVTVTGIGNYYESQQITFDIDDTFRDVDAYSVNEDGEIEDKLNVDSGEDTNWVSCQPGDTMKLLMHNCPDGIVDYGWDDEYVRVDGDGYVTALQAGCSEVVVCVRDYDDSNIVLAHGSIIIDCTNPALDLGTLSLKTKYTIPEGLAYAAGDATAAFTPSADGFYEFKSFSDYNYIEEYYDDDGEKEEDQIYSDAWLAIYTSEEYDDDSFFTVFDDILDPTRPFDFDNLIYLEAGTTYYLELNNYGDVPYDFAIYKQNTIPETGLFKSTADGKWYYVSDYDFDFEFEGPVKNQYGWWYVSNGTIDFTFTGMAKNQYGWFYFTKGKLDTTYTGLAKNQYGWWYMKNGKLDTTYTGMAKNQYGWWYVTKGKLNSTYTGLGKNSYGTWYFKNGKVQTGFTGYVTISGKKYHIVKGKVK